MHRLSALIPSEHWQAITRHARENDRTLAQEVRRMVRLYVTLIQRQEVGHDVPTQAAEQVPA